jgi:hypothetical protein
LSATCDHPSNNDPPAEAVPYLTTLSHQSLGDSEDAAKHVLFFALAYASLGRLATNSQEARAMNRHSSRQVVRDLRRIKRLRRLLSVLLFAAVVAVVRLPVWSYFNSGGVRGPRAATSVEAAPEGIAAARKGATAGDAVATHTEPSPETSQQRSPTVAATTDRDVEGPFGAEGGRWEPSLDLDHLGALAGRMACLFRAAPASEPGPAGGKQANDQAELADGSAEAPDAGIPAGQPNQTAAPETRTETMRIHNPQRNGGVVHYLVDGAAFSLHPGQWHELPAGAPLEITYDGGGNFGERRLLVRSGVFVFEVSAQHGWQLKPQERVQ